MANESVYSVVPNGPLSDEQCAIIMESGSIVCSVLSFLGIISNIINIRAFIAMGLLDGVTVSFLFLSVFDLNYLMMSFCLGLSLFLNIMEIQYDLLLDIEPFGLFVFFSNVAIQINITNTLTTTFLAVARCMCVARPLHFKNTFSLTKTVVINLGFITFAMVTYTPILANMAMLPHQDRRTNKTRPSLWLSKNREAIKDGVFMVVNTLLPFLTEVVIIICVFVMASSLRTASRFRQTSALKTEKTIPPKLGFNSSEKTPNSAATVADKMSGKGQRVVQQVILISVVYIICNTAKILVSFVGLIVTQFRLTGRYNSLYVATYSLQKCLEVANASVNTFIYYSYNTRFRKVLLLLFCKIPDK